MLSILPLTKVMFCTLSGEAANFANSFCMRVSKLFMDELCLWVRCVGVRVCVCKRRWMRVCATPATLLFLLACQLLPHDTGADKRRRNKHRATNPDQARHAVPSVPRLPRKTTVDVPLCRVCVCEVIVC